MIRTNKWKIYVPGDFEWLIDPDTVALVDEKDDEMDARFCIADALDIGVEHVDVEKNEATD